MIEVEEVYVKLSKKYKLPISEIKLIWESKFRHISNKMSEFNYNDKSTYNNFFINEFGKFIINELRVKKVKNAAERNTTEKISE